MAERKFKLGDRVRPTAGYLHYPDSPNGLSPKDVGTVLGLDGRDVAVDWGRNVGGHDFICIKGLYRSVSCCGAGWWMREALLEPAKVSEVHIKSDGKKTEAYIKNGERGSCICSKSDEFDFPTGAAIALARAYGIDPADLAQRICKAVGSGTGKTPVQSVFHKKLMLKDCFNYYGEVGTPTKFVDCHGTPLCVGDTVSLYSARTNRHYGDAFVAAPHGREFIMGLANSCFNGKIDPVWYIIWQRSWKELKPGDEVDGIKVVEYKEDKA